MIFASELPKIRRHHRSLVKRYLSRLEKDQTIDEYVIKMADRITVLEAVMDESEFEYMSLAEFAKLRKG